MKELSNNLFLGSMMDYELLKNDDQIVFVQACAFPYYNENIKNNTGDKLHVFSNDNKCLSLNLIDTYDFNYDDYLNMFKIMKLFIDKNIEDNRVLIHCNLGQTRSATLALLYLKTRGYYQGLTLIEAENEFVRIYPNYSQGMGIRDFALEIWDII